MTYRSNYSRMVQEKFVVIWSVYNGLLLHFIVSEMYSEPAKQLRRSFFHKNYPFPYVSITEMRKFRFRILEVLPKVIITLLHMKYIKNKSKMKTI